MASPSSPRPWAGVPLQDEASWRLPDWEAYSESGASAWTDDGGGSESDGASLRVPRVLRSTTTLTRVDDLRALHARFAQARRLADSQPHDDDRQELLDAQIQIAAQLDQVREELRAFQHAWHDTNTLNKPKEEDVAPVALPRDALRFDMAVQTDVAAVHDDALRQWLSLITQKMEVLATSFHSETTQLPLRFPLETPLVRAKGGPNDEEFSVASWHVGGQLTTLVGEATADKLLDLERAVACLATATRHTTTRYVEYFEKIVEQIQDLHQQRLRQVVDESLEEMKTQRAKYKKRVEQLEAECREAKDEVVMWQQKAMAAANVNAIDEERLEAVAGARQQQWEREREQLVTTIERLQRQKTDRTSSQSETETRVEELEAQLKHMATMLEAARQESEAKRAEASVKDEQLRQLKQQHRTEIERFEQIHSNLRDEILQFQRHADQSQQEMRGAHVQELERVVLEAAATKVRDMARLRQEHEKQIDAIEQTWRARLEDVEETKMLAPIAMAVDQQVQTENEYVDEGTAEERIARLKKRCKALENLLDKKFEDSSAASVASMDSGTSARWSSRSESRFIGNGDDIGSRTLPLTMSFESSLDDTYTYTHPENTPSRDGMKTGQHDVWEFESNRPGPSLGKVASSVGARTTSPDPDTPSQEAMLALVRKLEALATATQSPGSASAAQPDEEPDMSAATTPTRKPPISSGPTSASSKKWAPNRSFGLAGSYSAAVHTMKDPRRQQHQQAGKSKNEASTGPTSAPSTGTKPRQQHRNQNRFVSR